MGTGHVVSEEPRAHVDLRGIDQAARTYLEAGEPAAVRLHRGVPFHACIEICGVGNWQVFNRNAFQVEYVEGLRCTCDVGHRGHFGRPGGRVTRAI